MPKFLRSVLQKNGTAEQAVFQVETVELEPPPAGHIQVKVSKAGVAFADVLQRLGLYPGVPKGKVTLGYDLVGTITAVGSGVSNYAIGDRVVALTVWSAHQQYVNIPAEGPGRGDSFTPKGGRGRLALVPMTCSSVSDEKLVSLVLNYVTAYQMMFRSAKLHQETTRSLRRTQVILVHGAAGGVGTAMLQLASVYGIRCIGTASAGKHDLVRRLGGDPVDYSKKAWVEEVARLAGPEGVEAVFDPVGGSTTDTSYKVLRKNGAMVLFGSSCLHPREQGKLGGVAKFVWNLLSGWLTSFFSRRTFKFYLITDNDPSKGAGSDWACDMDILFGLIASGKIDPVIDSVLPLSEVGSALAKLDDKGTRGKVVIDCTLSN